MHHKSRILPDPDIFAIHSCPTRAICSLSPFFVFSGVFNCNGFSCFANWVSEDEDAKSCLLIRSRAMSVLGSDPTTSALSMGLSKVVKHTLSCYTLICPAKLHTIKMNIHTMELLFVETGLNYIRMEIMRCEFVMQNAQGPRFRFSFCYSCITNLCKS